MDALLEGFAATGSSGSDPSDAAADATVAPRRAALQHGLLLLADKGWCGPQLSLELAGGNPFLPDLLSNRRFAAAACNMVTELVLDNELHSMVEVTAFEVSMPSLCRLSHPIEVHDSFQVMHPASVCRAPTCDLVHHAMQDLCMLSELQALRIYRGHREWPADPSPGCGLTSIGASISGLAHLRSLKLEDQPNLLTLPLQLFALQRCGICAESHDIGPTLTHDFKHDFVHI